MGGITHHANGRQQPFSDSTTRGFRGKTVALVDTGVVDTRPVPFGRQHAVTAGGISRGRGHFCAAGDVRRRRGRWGLVVDAPLVGGVFCVWYWGWSGCAS